MKQRSIEPRTCPRCGRAYSEPSAISRRDGVMPICPDCGTREALESIGVKGGEQERILAAIHRSMVQ